MIDRIQLKREAREVVRGARVSAYLVAVVYLAVCFILRAIDTYVSGSLVTEMEYYYPEMPVPAFLQHNIPGATVVFISVAAMLLTAVLNAGYVLYHQGVRRGETMSLSSLFDGFSFAGKLILLQLMMTLSIFLWSLLLVIPGIIATYRLRFAVYNLCENPEMGVMEAMNMSTAQTRGYKMDLFVLDMSFFGWSLLSVFTCGLLNIWLSPYVVQTNLGYFRQIKRVKGIGWFPPEEHGDDGFRPQDPFGSGV